MVLLGLELSCACEMAARRDTMYRWRIMYQDIGRDRQESRHHESGSGRFVTAPWKVPQASLSMAVA